jgi:hypothetical protein
MAGGRPDKYDVKYNEQVFKLCLLGATDKQIADFFGVCEKTINNWKKKEPEFLQSLKKGKMQADAEIASALYHRAKGYSHPEDKIFNDNGSSLIVPTTKHYPPDTGAAFIWLKNRAGWKDKQEVDMNATVSLSDILAAMDDPE